ncbi:MAG: ParB/RepB/Spo0J family partition protein [Firmicutes bacterium]|nr:ParB/RepB/Spo0J family partition protein [Bacillota bacterium]
MAERGLGRGFGALFGESTEHAEGLTMLPVSKVEPREDQPRVTFDEIALEELADSLKTHGMIQPITARKLDSGFYQIIAGERRWRAARMAGLNEVPVRVLEADDRKATELALVENLQREDLNPIEEARGFKTLMDVYGITQEEAANRVGKSRPAVANALRLLSLSPEVLRMVETGGLSAGHARALLALDGASQLAAAKKISAEKLSVRQAELMAARLQKQGGRKDEEAKSDSAAVVVDYVREVERELSLSLGRGVKLVDAKKKGRIELEFYSTEDRENLIAALRTMNNEQLTVNN